MEQPNATPSPNPNQEKGRGPLILGLGIVSFLFLGPFLGIPAWIMGWSDLKKVRAGTIASSQKGIIQGGMIIGIVGTFFSPAFIGCLVAVGLSMFTAEQVGSHRDSIIVDIDRIATLAREYRVQGSTYEGFEIPGHLSETSNGSYSASPRSNGDLLIQGVSSIYEGNAVVGTLTSSGTLTFTFHGTYFGP